MKTLGIIFLTFITLVCAGQTYQVEFINKPMYESSMQKLDSLVAPAMGIKTMDIQYGGSAGCKGVSQLFMISEVLPKDTGVFSTGHLSCYSIIYDLGESYFIAHIDADELPRYPTYDSLARDIIQEHIGDCKVKKVLIGASNFSKAPKKFYMDRLEYISGLVPGLSEDIYRFFSGPNTVSMNLEEIMDCGGPDICLTTDIIFYNDTIIVIRPKNNDIFNASFEFSDFAKQIKTYYKAL